MLFHSISFFLFFPLAVLFFYAVPQRFRYLWLLGCSYYFYMCWNAKYAILLAASTLITYFSGLLLGRLKQERTRKLCVAGSFVLNLSILFFFKYFEFAIQTCNRVFERIGIDAVTPAFDVMLPVGISFYILQALSYTVDVYRGDTRAEKNVLKYALYVSFFPQLVAGPIERSTNLLHQIGEVHRFDYERVKNGLLVMLWGYFQKLVIADRIALYVDKVYSDYHTYGGVYLVLAAVLFSFQIYCDFSGYSTIAIGAARVMGFRLMENFHCPFLYQNTSALWKKWHISLTSWFRDYLYIPLGGNRKGKARSYLNIMIVFLTSGLWHGASWNFIIWGGLNGLFQVIGDITRSLREQIVRLLHLKPDSLGHKLLRVTITFSLFTFAMIFFRAPDVTTAFGIIRSIATVHNLWVIMDGSLFMAGLDGLEFGVLFLGLAVLLFVDICRYKRISVSGLLSKQALWFRWSVYLTVTAMVAVFGIWGTAYQDAAFIYFQF